jgi:N-carbamoylputrescine amidase
MSRVVRCGLIQAANVEHPEQPIEKIKRAMIDKHVALIEDAADKGVQIICLQELFYGPYFPAEQDPRWYALVESIPGGPTTRLMCDIAARHHMAMVVPIYEEEMTGVYYNTAAVIDADGKYLGKYRKTHIPHCLPAFWEKFYFTPGNLGFPTFQTRFARIGVYICYDRHFPEGARALGLNGAEIVFIPSATTKGHADYLWELEQRALAVANGYFVGTINRVGTEPPWNMGEFFGSSYFANPDGRILIKGSEDKDELIVADLNLEEIQEARTHWQFYRDRRPEMYNQLCRKELRMES